MKLIDENKRIASDHLKTADRLIKAGEFDRANEEIAKARIADPRNLYILAYEERIQYAREEALRKKEEAEKKKEEELRQKEEEEIIIIEEPPKKETGEKEKSAKDSGKEKPPDKKRSQTKAETPPAVQEEQPAEEVQGAKKEKPAKRHKEKHIFDEFIIKGTNTDEILGMIESNADRIARETVEDARLKAQAEYKEKIDKEIHDYEVENQKHSAEQIQLAVSTFQKRLETEAQVKLENEVKAMSAKADQALEERLLHLEDERQLRLAELLKELFTQAIEQLLIQGLSDEDYTRVITGLAHGLKISPEQTIQMKKKTQERFYMDAVEVAWSDGTVTLEESERLSALRDRFGITAEEHFQIESLVRRKMLEMKK